MPAMTSFLTQLKSHMEDMPYAFMAMSALSSAVALLVAWTGLRRYLFDRCSGPGFTLHSHYTQTRSDTKSRTL
jgi:Na+/H+ antiporter NhaC